MSRRSSGAAEELDLVLSRWRLVQGRTGQVVLISGEPGIGKSRLVLALREHHQAAPITLVSYACSPHHSNSPLFPFVTQLEREARFAPDDSSETRLQRLQSLLCEHGGGPSGEALPLFADLLGVPVAASGAMPQMSPQQRKVLLFRTILARLDQLAARGPLLMVLEDAHGLDPTSRELFDQIVDRLQNLPVLLVATFRPDHGPAFRMSRC